jgi:hypothetical protein
VVFCGGLWRSWLELTEGGRLWRSWLELTEGGLLGEFWLDPCLQLVNTSSKGEILASSKEEILINIRISTAALISYL